MGRIKADETLRRRAMPKEVLDGIDSTSQWMKYINSEDEKVSLDAWKYLHDRVYGRPKQAMVVEGDQEKPVGLRVEIVHIGSK